MSEKLPEVYAKLADALHKIMPDLIVCYTDLERQEDEAEIAYDRANHENLDTVDDLFDAWRAAGKRTFYAKHLLSEMSYITGLVAEYTKYTTAEKEQTR